MRSALQPLTSHSIRRNARPSPYTTTSANGSFSIFIRRISRPAAPSKHNFQRDLAQFEARNAVILGVSTQDEKTHESFCAKEGLNFKLLADTKSQVSKRYGSLINLVMTKLSARHTFLIDPQGIIRKVWLEVQPSRHSGEILDALSEHQRS